MKLLGLIALFTFASISAHAAGFSYRCTYTSGQKGTTVSFGEDGKTVLKKDSSLGFWGGPAFNSGTKLYVWGTDNKIAISVVLMSAASMDYASASAPWGAPKLELSYPVLVKTEMYEGNPMDTETILDTISCTRF